MIDLTRIVLRDLAGLPPTRASVREHLDAAMGWLCRAHDATGRQGVARSYSLKWQRAYRGAGWHPAYPETTGYIIKTFYNYAKLTGKAEYRERAEQMARWEAAVQMESGAVQGAVIGFPQAPAIFNTGQVLFGWARAYEETEDDTFRAAAVRAGDFMLAAQDPDGAWRRHGSKHARSGVNLYDTRSAWGVARAWQATGEARFRAVASRNFEFALTRQTANGWYAECCLDDDREPLLHTLAYTMEGLLEGGVLLDEPRFLESARRAADALLPLQRADGSLPGRFDSAWRPAVGWSCLTGDAQTSIVWLRLFQLTGETRYRDAGLAMNRFLMRTQRLDDPNPGVRGAIKGSHPLWGGYGPFEYPNWGAKFFADALLLEDGPSPEHAT